MRGATRLGSSRAARRVDWTNVTAQDHCSALLNRLSNARGDGGTLRRHLGKPRRSCNACYQSVYWELGLAPCTRTWGTPAGQTVGTATNVITASKPAISAATSIPWR